LNISRIRPDGLSLRNAVPTPTTPDRRHFDHISDNTFGSNRIEFRKQQPKSPFQSLPFAHAPPGEDGVSSMRLATRLLGWSKSPALSLTHGPLSCSVAQPRQCIRARTRPWEGPMGGREERIRGMRKVEEERGPRRRAARDHQTGGPEESTGRGSGWSSRRPQAASRWPSVCARRPSLEPARRRRGSAPESGAEFVGWQTTGAQNSAWSGQRRAERSNGSRSGQMPR